MLIRQQYRARFLPAIVAALLPTFAFAGEGDVKLQFSSQDTMYLWISLGFAVLSIAIGWIIAKKILAQSPGNDKMQEVQGAIREGAMAYLRKQVRTMSFMVVLLGAGLYLLYMRDPNYGPIMSMWLVVCFLAGVAASYTAGYIGMGMAVQGNARAAHAAVTSLKAALETAFQAGAVSGLFTVGMGLLGATLIFMLAKENAMQLLIGFGFGGSLAALFMRVGGGIFTKAADVGADLVGKVEAGIPEDDPRNPATIADNVGDNVGDCAGMAADVFESYEVTLVAAIILGAATAPLFPGGEWMKLIIFALMARGLGIIASIVGIFGMKGSDSESVDPLSSISKGFKMSAALALILTFGFAFYYMGSLSVTTAAGATVLVEWWRFAVAVGFGILMAFAIERLTDYYVSTEKRPVKEVAAISNTGPAPMVIQGFAYGMESSVWSVFAIVIALLAPLFIFPPGLFGGPLLSFYGIALTGLGLLTTTGYILAMDTFGPISDNAQGVFEMSGVSKELEGERAGIAHRIVQRLDAAGNTTKALTKGFAIATAVVAATALFHSFVEAGKLGGHGFNAKAELAKESTYQAGMQEMSIAEQVAMQSGKNYTPSQVIQLTVGALESVGVKSPTPEQVARTMVAAGTTDMKNFDKNLPETAGQVAGRPTPASGLPIDIPQIFLGLLIGGAAPFLFGAYSINAVGRAAFKLINEVRRQFRNDPGIMLGTSKPDYGKCVEIATTAAQQELLSPGILAIALPCLVGFGLAFGAQPVAMAGGEYVLTGAQALGGFLAGAILSGQLLAVLLANSGGIWDNAKKTIEDGLHGGKGTDAHKAGVVVDTIGDPFKDTAGPAMNPLIKVMNLVSLLLVPIMIQPLDPPGKFPFVRTVVVVVCLAALAFAVYLSKRGSLATELALAMETPPAEPDTVTASAS